MADDSEQGGQTPDLELPSLFGRKKKKDKAAEPEATPEPTPEPTTEEPTRRLPPVPRPEAAAPEATTPEPTPAPPPPPPQPQTDPVRVARESMPAMTYDPDAQREETTVLPAGTTMVEEQPAAPAKAPKPPKPPKQKRERKPIVLPKINPYLAAMVTGLVCGLVAVVLEVGAQRGCESVRGVGSCGGLGLVALLVILAVVIALGAVLLRAFGVSDPASTSGLGIGIVAVLTLVFFLGSLESMWMFVVLPVLTAVSFAISYWITDTVVTVPRDEDESTTVT